MRRLAARLAHALLPGLLLALGLGLPLASPLPTQAQDCRLGLSASPGSQQSQVAMLFANLLSQRSQGRWKVEVLQSGAMGNEAQVLESLRQGRLAMAVLSASALEPLVPEMRALQVPFLFDDLGQVDEALGGEAGQALLESLDQAGLKGLAFGESGFRHLTNNRGPVHSVEDVQGLKVRVTPSAIDQALWQALGAQPVMFPWPINLLLAQGGAQAQENPLWVLPLYHMSKLQKYLSLTAHAYAAHVCLANAQWYRSLAPMDQALVRRGMRAAAAQQRRQVRAEQERLLAKLKAQGMIVDESPDRESFRRKARAVESSPLLQDPRTQAMLARLRQAAK